MKELEFYDECSEWFAAKSKKARKEGAKVSYLLIAVVETETDIGLEASIVDPSIPNCVNRDKIFDLSLGQQALVLSKDDVRKTMTENVQLAVETNKMRDLLSPEVFDPILDKAESNDQLKELVKEASHNMSTADKMKALSRVMNVPIPEELLTLIQ